MVKPGSFITFETAQKALNLSRFLSLLFPVWTVLWICGNTHCRRPPQDIVVHLPSMWRHTPVQNVTWEVSRREAFTHYTGSK